MNKAFRVRRVVVASVALSVLSATTAWASTSTVGAFAACVRQLPVRGVLGR